MEECFSEDPYLAGEMSYSIVTGLQGMNVSATVKHFLGYAEPEQGLNTGPVHGGERELRTTYVFTILQMIAIISDPKLTVGCLPSKEQSWMLALGGSWELTTRKFCSLSSSSQFPQQRLDY